MASQNSEVVSNYTERTHKLFSQGRWVKNVLLTDIRKAGFFPPGDVKKTYINRRLSNVTSEALESGIETLKSKKPIEGYVSFAKCGKCFVAGCDFNAETFVNLLLHVLRSHESVNEFSCLYCSHVGSLSGMVEHLSRHSSTMFQCKYCSYHHYSLLNVREHIKSIHDGLKIAIIKLRDFKGEDTQEKCNFKLFKEDDFNDETKLKEHVDVTEECCGYEGQKVVEKSKDLNDCLDKVGDRSKNSKNGLGGTNSDMEYYTSESEGVTGIFVNVPSMDLISNSEILADESENEVPEIRVNIKSTALNYHSTESELRKTELEKNWHCGLCDFVSLYNSMIAHALSAHEIHHQFKCSKCSIFIPNRSYVDSHCSVLHPKNLVTLIAYYYLPGSTLPYKEVTVTLPDGQVIFSPDSTVFVNRIPELLLVK